VNSLQATLLALCAAIAIGATAPGLDPQLAFLTVEDAEDAMEVTLEELRDFKWRRGKQPPKRIRALDGMRVRVSGFMALGTPEGVEEFTLLSDSCGCDGNTKPHHFILVQLTDETTTFTPDEIVVTGVLSIGEEEEDGFITSLYRLEAETIE
jgi:hypothetical protein